MTANSEEKDVKETPKPLFRELAADDDEPQVTELESLCVSCEENVRAELTLKYPN